MQFCSNSWVNLGQVIHYLSFSAKCNASVRKVNEYDQEQPQPLTADQITAPLGKTLKQ